MKTLSLGIPCYNSAAYMDHCVSSILEGAQFADDVEILIVDDGSTKDDTWHKAQEWQQCYPGLVRAIHQENGGHGLAVMKAVEHAQGLYFKNIDSDDWVDKEAFGRMLEVLRSFSSENVPVDMLITNYVYEHVEDNTQRVVSYTKQLPTNRPFTWDELGHFAYGQYLLMHTITYRTEVLRAAQLAMPAHTFYVDNIYAYVPFPLVKTLYYLDADVYRYFIGRDDQSVNDAMLTKRVDHYWRVARIMMKSYHLYTDVASERLAEYMMSYFTIMMAICSVFSKKSDRPDAQDELAKLWDELKAYDTVMYEKARHGLIGQLTNLPGWLGTNITLGGYKIAQKLFKFN